MSSSLLIFSAVILVLVGILVREFQVRGQTEQALRDTEQRLKLALDATAKERNLLRTVIDLMPDNIFVKDTGGRFLLNNKVSLEMLGVTKQEEALGKTDIDFWPRELADESRTHEEGILKSGQTIIDQEYFQPWMTGAWRWLTFSTIPVHDEHGNVIGLVGTTHDISERKRAEERERAIAHSLRGVVEAADELIAVQDPDMFYRRAVELAREKLGVERCGIWLFDPTHEYRQGTFGTDNQGHTVDERDIRLPSVEEFHTLLSHSGELWVVQTAEHSYWDKAQFHGVGRGWIATTFIRIDNEPIGTFANDTAISHRPLDPVQQEAIVLYCSLLGHILKRRRGEDALRKSEALYRIISELISDYAFCNDILPDGSLKPGWITEDSYLRLTGYRWDEVGITYKLYHPDYEEMARRDVEQVVQGHANENDYRIITKNGELRWLHIRRQPEWSETEGRVVRYYGAAEDITERKRAEQIRQEADLLRIELEKERELRELKSRFVATIVHDFRNPLTAIQLTLLVFAGQAGRLTAQQIEEKVQRASQDVQRLNSLIDDVLMVGQLDFATNEFNPEEVDLTIYLQAILEQFKAGINTKTHDILFNGAGATVNAVIDRKLFGRAIVNLLDNAVKYSPSGGKVALGVANKVDSVVVTVSDEGIGIPDADRKHVFEEFHRASNVGTIEGTGLGLTIVKRVITAHGGSLEYTNGTTHGTVFTITLPML
jgi:PAS domain S-box-containing protein